MASIYNDLRRLAWKFWMNVNSLCCPFFLSVFYKQPWNRYNCSLQLWWLTLLGADLFLIYPGVELHVHVNLSVSQWSSQAVSDGRWRENNPPLVRCGSLWSELLHHQSVSITQCPLWLKDSQSAILCWWKVLDRGWGQWIIIIQCGGQYIQLYSSAGNNKACAQLNVNIHSRHKAVLVQLFLPG